MLPQFPNRTSLANLPTEFRPLDRISEALGGPRIWIKHDDLTGSVLSGNKVRKLEFLVAEAQQLGANALVTCGGIQSNHCRATALVAARLGLRCHLLLRGPTGLVEKAEAYSIREACDSSGFEGNVLLDLLSGASISVYSPGYYALNLDDLLAEEVERYRKQGITAYAIPTGGSNATGLWGYIQAAEELIEDFKAVDITPSSVYCATGSGGTQGGLTLGFQLLNYSAPVVGVAVCDSQQYFGDKIKEDVAGWAKKYHPQHCEALEKLVVHTIDSYIGPGYARGYPELYDLIAYVAKLEGVVLDPVYTGKAFLGLVEEIKKGRYAASEDVVFVHTGGVYGLFPFKHAFYSE